MAELTISQRDVVVRLRALERLATWRRDLRVPLECLRMVYVEEAPLAAMSLRRWPGFSWPGAFTLGCHRHDGVREFAAVRAGQPAVVLEIEGARWDRLVVSHPDAVNLAAELAGLLLGRGPGRRGGTRGRGHDADRGLTLQRTRARHRQLDQDCPQRAPMGAACPLA